MITQFELTLAGYKRGYHLITDKVLSKLKDLPEKGLVNLFLKHTSAGICINENADPSVRYDFESFLNRIIPDQEYLYSHTLEGSDDMPAHLKSSILGQSLNIPVTGKRLNLGTWQGIYLGEFRNEPSSRVLIITVIGE